MSLRFVVAFAVSVVSAAAGQRPPTLSRLEAGTCPSCAVTFELIATVGKPTDAELIADGGRLASLADGGFVVAGIPSTTPLLHYDRRGNYIGTLGTVGDGPGEYRWPQSIVRARADSISIMGQRTITTISTVSGRGRSETVAGALESFTHVVFGDGTSVVNVNSLGQVAFASLTPRSELKKRFGPEQPPLVLPRQNGRTIRDQYSTQTWLAPSLAGGFWAASTWYAHHLQRVTEDGVVLVDLRRHPTWFPPYTYADIDEKLYRLGELRTPRPSQTNGIGVDSAGHLFVVSRVADAHWQKDPKALPPQPPGGEYPVQKLEPTGGIDRYVDGILEVYSDKSGALLGSWRSDTPLGTLTPHGLLILRDQDDDGVTSFRAYRIRVVGEK